MIRAGKHKSQVSYLANSSSERCLERLGLYGWLNQIKNTKENVLNVIAIGSILILPHTELIPNFGYSIPLLLFVWVLLKYSNASFSDIGFNFKRINLKSFVIGSLVAICTLGFMQYIFFPVLEHFILRSTVQGAGYPRTVKPTDQRYSAKLIKSNW